jgi:hypothetical protein
VACPGFAVACRRERGVPVHYSGAKGKRAFLFSEQFALHGGSSTVIGTRDHVTELHACHTLPTVRTIGNFTNMYFIEYNLLTAAAVLSILPMQLIFITLQRWVVQAVVMRGLNG